MMLRKTGRTRTPRWKRKRQILRILFYWGNAPITMTQIAFWLYGCQPSNHVLKILHEMEADKMIASKRVAYRSNASKLLWQITDVGVQVVFAIDGKGGNPSALSL